MGAYPEYTHPDDRERMVHYIDAPEKIPNDIIYRLRGTDGIYRWFQTRAEPYFNEDGSLYRWYALNSDIDDLYRSREFIQEREFQLNLLIETVPAIIWKASPDGNIAYVNGKTLEYTGRSLEDIQQGWIDLHPDDTKDMLHRWHGLLAGGDGYEFVTRVRGRDGQYRWFQASASAVRDDYGNTIAYHGVMLDTTNRKNAEVALQKSEEHFRKMMDAVPTLLWSHGPAGEDPYINKRTRDYTGLTLEDMPGINASPCRSILMIVSW
jgi:PAS domain S-box-containing protein